MEVKYCIQNAFRFSVILGWNNVVLQTSAVSCDDNYASVIKVYSLLYEKLPYFVHTKSYNPVTSACT
jgi:hypothetical protein